jgi:hypothetical protein
MSMLNQLGEPIDAIARIEASRTALRLAMMPTLPAPTHRRPTGEQSWLHKLGALPLVHAVVESVESWWSNHPLRPIGQVAGEASNAIIKPIAQSSPFMLMLVTALIGAGLAWSRPWRWAFRSALFAGLVPQLASRIVSSLPIESWMAMVGSVLATPRATQPNSMREAEPDARAA